MLFDSHANLVNVISSCEPLNTVWVKFSICGEQAGTVIFRKLGIKRVDGDVDATTISLKLEEFARAAVLVLATLITI
jgi:hypothetical protein